MKDEKGCCSMLSTCNLGMTLGIIWGLNVLVVAYLGMWFDLGLPIVDSLSTLYRGLDTTFVGGLIGLFWGFVHGWIVGVLISKVYHYCACKCPCKECKMHRKHH